jgi:hypothetical protein
MQTKTSTAEVKELDERGEGSLVFATFGVRDRDGDVIVPGSIGEQFVVMAAAHDWTAAPIGKARIYEYGNEARADFALNLAMTGGRNWYNALKFDLDHPPARQQHSFGFTADVFSYGELEGQQVRYLRRVTVHEISPVMLGAGVNTRTLTLKQREDMRRVEKTLERGQIFLMAERFKEQTASLFRCKETRPDFDYQLAAYTLAHLAAEELGAEFRGIEFFREADGDEKPDFVLPTKIRGIANPESAEFMLAANLGGSQLINTIGHEVYHLADPDGEHANAYEYGARFAAQFGAIPSWSQVFVSGDGFDLARSYPDAPQAAVLVNTVDGFTYTKAGLCWERRNRWRYD